MEITRIIQSIKTKVMENKQNVRKSLKVLRRMDTHIERKKTWLVDIHHGTKEKYYITSRDYLKDALVTIIIGFGIVCVGVAGVSMMVLNGMGVFTILKRVRNIKNVKPVKE